MVKESSSLLLVKGFGIIYDKLKDLVCGACNIIG